MRFLLRAKGTQVLHPAMWGVESFLGRISSTYRKHRQLWTRATEATITRTMSSSTKRVGRQWTTVLGWSRKWCTGAGSRLVVSIFTPVMNSHTKVGSPSLSFPMRCFPRRRVPNETLLYNNRTIFDITAELYMRWMYVELKRRTPLPLYLIKKCVN